MAARPGAGWARGWRCACCEVPLARVTIAPSASGIDLRVVAQPQDALPLCRNIPAGLPLIDTHSHVRAVPRGLEHCVVVGTSPDDWPRVVTLRREPKITIGFGVHPWYVGDAPSDWAETLERRLLACPDAIVGEIGLDRGRRGAPWEAQRAAFASQLALAARLRRPVSVHCVRAHGACLDDLRACDPPPPAVALHSFSGAAELARNYARQVAAPVYFGFSASLSLQSSSFGEALRAVAADRLLLESDAAEADDAAAGCAAVLAALADARGWSLAEAAERTRRNAHEFLAAVGGIDSVAVKLIDLPADLLAHVLVRVPLAHDIGRAAKACRVLRSAARLAFVERYYSRAVVTLTGHNDDVAWCPHHDVSCVMATPDGRIFTGSLDMTIVMWSGSQWEHSTLVYDSRISTSPFMGPEHVHESTWAHRGPLDGLALTPDGFFLSGSADKTVKLWTLNGALERTFDVGSRAFRIAVMPDGVHFVVIVTWGGNQREMKLYHVDGTVVGAFDLPVRRRDLSSLAVTPDGQHVICGSNSGPVYVWSVESKSIVSTCRGHTANVGAVAAMLDGKRFLSGGNDYSVRKWFFDGTLEKTLFGLDQLSWTTHVHDLVVLPDNQHALCASTHIRLFNVNDGTVLRTFNHHRKDVMSLALLSDGLRFVSGSRDGTASVVYHGLYFPPSIS